MAELDDVIAALGDSLESLAAETCLRIYHELSSYRGVEPAALASAVSRNLRTALTALREQRVPSPATLDGAALTAKERYGTGVPVEEIIRGFRISISLIHERFVDLAISMGLPVEAVVAGSRTMWGVGDAFTTRIITTYQALELDTALRDAQHRAAVVRALLAGETPDDALVAIDADGQYAAIRCEVPPAENAERVRRQLESSGSRGSVRALVVLDGGICLGIVAARPTDPTQAVGMGPFVRPDDLARSDRIARQALRLAQRLGRRGVQSVEELGWRLAAVSRPDVWRLYADRFLLPVLIEGPFGEELLDTVKAWLACAGSIPRTAEALTVHVNTVRYRLRRFEELTGSDLADPEHLMGVTWALELGDPDTFTL